MSNENVENRLQPQVAVEDSPIFPDTSTSCVDVWMEKMNKGVLTSLNFREFWRVWVPKIYSPERNGNCLAWSIDEGKAQKILFNPLEEFICNGDPQVVLKELTKMDNPPSMCGRVFKMGEPTYSCRECGVDSTCVLCVGCFQQSAHRDHKYKMGTSGGGGCCDCGDTEAWKKAPFCEVHLAGTQSKESRGNKLPGDIAERAVVAFEAVLEYCYELLTLKYTVALPANLCVKDTVCFELATEKLDAFDSYCTVLFNDETHTFDQVINTLQRVLKCSQRDAVEYVNNVDREGRSVVRCSVFRNCNDLRSDIERFTSRHSNRPLKVLVLHTHVVAHQTFSMKLLNWLQQFISHCEGFRVLFSNIALNTKLPDTSIVEGILTRDSQLWKSARTAWHRLFITGMLMEYESKKALAVVFTQNYGSVMKDFIRDDHDHSFSIVSLSVQLFTVPTLAHHLIAHHDALFTLLNTLLSEIARRCNAAGKLEFERNTPNTSFKRALYIFYDLRYILSAKPDEWTDELRVNYLHGVTLLLTLFCSMQCMDAVLRQVGQHMEYEPEWESAITLHFKLSPVITLGLEWCGSDKVVLVASFRMVLRKLYEQLVNGSEPAPSQVRELADHSATCLQYDVSSQPVSIHLPLSRFLAGLFLHLEKYNLHFQSAEFISQTKPTPEQIIEPVLTAQVMISQVYSGMWRRNGYSVLNQLYFYHSVKCRHEMLDRDIVLLQVGASLIESNEFLIHILNKFNLLNWAQPDFEANALKNQEEDSMRQTINLVEEFLGLLITIIGERYVPGVGQVTTDDRFKKEIIQQLCIKPQPHSELIKQLVDDAQHLEPDMETVICEVADFKKPAHKSAGKGVYELKPHLYSEYNVFFYHYTKEELSISEEAQRKRRKTLGELECCPPPKLPRLTETFNLVANLLQCDVMLHIMQTVLGRAQNFIARSFSEPQVHKILHLIGYALQEQESGHYPFLAFPERAAKWNIYKLLEDLSSSQRIEAHKDLLKWTLTKYREVASYTAIDVMQAPPQIEQSADTGETKKLDKEWRTRMAAQKRAKVMAQMAAMQKHFMKKNASLFAEAALEAAFNKSYDDHGSVMDLSSNEPSQEPSQVPVAVGINQTSRICEQKSYTCILCQEDQTVTANGPAMVLATFVQQSTVLCQRRPDNDEANPLYLSAKLGASPYTSTCGHVMHGRCWQDYFDNVLAKENRRPYRMRQPASFDAENHEYLCPLCECLSNTVLLLVPPLGMMQPTPKKQPDVSFEKWLEVMWLALECKPNRKHGKKTMEVEDEEMLNEDTTIVPPMSILRRELGDAVADAFESVYSQSGPHLVDNMEGMIHVFAALFTQATYLKGFGPADDDHRIPLWAWKSTAYTIHAIEFLLRDMEKPLLGALSSRQQDSLQNLARMSALLGASFANKSHLWADRGMMVCQAMTLLTILLDNPHQGPCIFDWDPFGVLVPLINLLPSLFHTKPNEASPPIITGGVFESHALKLVFICHIVKILLTIDLGPLESSMDVDSPCCSDMETEGATTENAVDSDLALIQILGTQINQNVANELWRRAETACRPFLRCCVLYFHYVTDVPAPEALTQMHGDTYESMCIYLGLPTTCRALINSNLNVVLKLAQVWKSHPTVWQHLLGVKKVPIVKDPLKVNKLIDLPEDYSDLINSISTFSCPNSDQEDSRNPTLCLVCGEMLCSQSYCCQTEVNKMSLGACTYHTSKCGTGVGMFLRVRECDILFLRSPTRGTHMCPPYLDEYGETDQGLRRGNPLHLCHEKYRRLNYIWLSHELHESIARAIESSSSMVPAQWQHM